MKTAIRLAAIAALLSASFVVGLGTYAHAQDQCPNGTHWVQPPCYYDAQGYERCPAGYWACN